MEGEPTFGDWLKSRRRQLDLTQKGLAHQVRCSVGTIRKIEADERRPSRQLAGLLAECLDIPPDQHEVFIAFARSEAYISETLLPVLPATEDQVTVIPQETKIPKIKHNLPLESTPFVGREAELAALDELFSDQDRRLVTIVGPGGIGKTRLALAYAGQWVNQDGSETHPYKGGVYLVDLAPLAEAERLVFRLAETLNLRIQAGAREQRSPKHQVLDYLRDRSMLLVLDNFEHLLSRPKLSETEIETDAANLVAEILGTGPGVCILVTSRERLNLQLEQVYPIQGLAFPDREFPEDAAEYSALKLFTQTAQSIQPDFVVAASDWMHLTRISQLVEGMPLGLELAAAWVDVLSLADIAAEIQQSLDFLETEWHDVPSRHRSMRATFETSWRKMDEKEQSIFSQLSIFRGGFTREAAQAVTGTTLRQLSRLADKSFIQFDQQRNRYQIHELLRQYGAEWLGRDSELERVAFDRHCSYYFQLLVDWDRALHGTRQVAAVQEMVLEVNNIRLAWRWAVTNSRFKALMAGINTLSIFFDRKYQRLEGEAICRSLEEKFEGSKAFDSSKPGTQGDVRKAQIDYLKLQTRALAWEGYFNLRLGNLDRSDTLLQKCLSMFESGELTEQDTRFEKALAYLVLTCVMRLKNESRDQTEQLVKKAMILFRSLDEPWWVGFALYTWGEIGSSIYERNYFEESYTAQSKLGDLRGMADSLEFGSYDPASHFQFEKADAMLDKALAISMELDDRHKVVAIYATLGWQWVWQGRFNEARALYSQTLAIYSDLDYSQSEAIQLHAHLGYPDLYLGEYQAARSQAQHAVKILREAKNYNSGLWNAYCMDIFGKAALAEGSYLEAERYFQECQMVFQSYNHTEKISTTLALLGYIARATNQVHLAQGYFYQALDMAIQKLAIMTLAHTLPGIALLYADQGYDERAVEFYALACTMGLVANSRWFDDIAGDQISAVAARLPDEAVEAAKKRVHAPISWERAAELLTELEELGWGSAELLSVCS